MRNFRVRAKARAALHSAVAAVALTAVGIPARAAVITTPGDLAPGTPFYVVFVTDGTRDATSSTIADYDTFVSNDAGATTYNSSSVTWQALVSIEGGVQAAARFSPSAPVYRLDGTRVADNGADLWDGSIQAPISTSPTGTVADTVWTGSTSSGQEAKGMGGQLFDPGVGGAIIATEDGFSTAMDHGWVDQGFTTSVSSQHLYAFSNQLTAIPEPASAALLAAVGALAAMASRRR